MGHRRSARFRTRQGDLKITGLPKPLPHPDYVDIDFVERTACIIGPRTEEGKANFDVLVANKSRFLDELRETYLALETATTPKQRRKPQKQFEEQLELIGLINKLAPMTETDEG